MVTNTAANGYADLAFGLPARRPRPANVRAHRVVIHRDDTLVSRMHGKIFIPAKGIYTFGVGSDDGSMLFIDGATVVSNNFYQAHRRRTGAPWSWIGVSRHRHRLL